jgi:hypothetical protein
MVESGIKAQAMVWEKPRHWFAKAQAIVGKHPD